MLSFCRPNVFWRFSDLTEPPDVVLGQRQAFANQHLCAWLILFEKLAVLLKKIVGTGVVTVDHDPYCPVKVEVSPRESGLRTVVRFIVSGTLNNFVNDWSTVYECSS